jgi:IclR family acetate operon transcriptional repressor
VTEQQVERSYSVAAAEKALRVLDAFVNPPHRFNLTDIANLASVSTNQAFRLLQTLVGAGYVVQDPESRFYRLGPRLFGLVGALYRGDALLVAGTDVLTWAHRETGETVALIVPDGDETICLDVRESAHPLLVSATVGSRSSDLHTGAVGKLILSARPDGVIHDFLSRHVPLKRYTDKTPVTIDAVLAEVRAIRELGYSVSDEEIAEGMYGIAAPVLDRTGQFVAAVTLSAPITRANPDQRARHRDVMVEAGRRISMNLGFRAQQRGGVSA